MSELVERLRDIYANDDHARGCEGRTYSCSCGFDDRTFQTAEEAASEITRLQEALAAAEARIAALADTLDCAKTDWEGCNGEIISDSDPHWTVEARRLLRAISNEDAPK